MRPKKSLGQNFLLNASVAKKIVNTLDIQENDLIIEIGAGKGALTNYLIEKNAQIIAIDLDVRAIEFLQARYSSAKNLRLMNEDIRKISYPELFKENNNKKIKVIGNLPYYLSSEILFSILENVKYISQAVIMLQKEVAKRIIAKPHSKDYGILSIATALVSKIDYICDVSPGSFFPKPKVYSSVIKLNFYDTQVDIDEYDWIMKVVKQSFNKRRKILKNSLQNLIHVMLGLDIENFIEYAIIKNFNKFEERAEDLSPEEFVHLSKLLKEFIK